MRFRVSVPDVCRISRRARFPDFQGSRIGTTVSVPLRSQSNIVGREGELPDAGLTRTSVCPRHSVAGILATEWRATNDARTVRV